MHVTLDVKSRSLCSVGRPLWKCSVNITGKKDRDSKFILFLPWTGLNSLLSMVLVMFLALGGGGSSTSLLPVNFKQWIPTS